MLRAIAVLLLACGVCRGDVELEFVDGADVGIEPVLAAHKAAATAEGKNTWLWGAVGWNDPSGCYAYFTFHGYGSGYLFRLGPDGLYHDITPPGIDRSGDGVVDTFPPRETRPIPVDANLDGFVDLLHTGNESPNNASLIASGDGTFALSMAHRIAQQGTVTDANGDEFPDVESYRASSANWGSGYIRRAINLEGAGFRIETENVVMPEGCPAEVVDRVAAADDRFHMPRVWELDADHYLVTYGGSYGGEKFTYAIRRGAGGDQVVDIGLPLTGWAQRPIDVDGDGALDVVIQYTAAAGVYRQTAPGAFALDTAGDMPKLNAALAVGTVAYPFDLWAIDLDQDGDRDLIASNKRSRRAWVMDNRDGVFVEVAEIQHVDGEAVWPADLDGDGDVDLIVAGGGNTGTSAQNSDQAAIYRNRLNPSSPPDPDPEPDPDPDPEPEETIAAQLIAVQSLIADAQAANASGDLAAVVEASARAREILRAVELEAGNVGEPPPPDPEPDPDPQPLGMIPLPDFDPDSEAWGRWVSYVERQGASASGHALIYAATREEFHRTEAIAKAQARVDADTVAGNQYLQAGGQFSDVFRVLAWCNVPEAQALEWAEWGRRHLGATDGSVPGSLWAKDRWARNNPANNYYHSFIVATSAYAMATADEEWLEWLRTDRLPRMFSYYATTPEGGSREGTGYGESHRSVFAIAKQWRDYDGTEVIPQAFIDGSLRYWAHATAPGHQWVALIGDHTRTHGRTDGYHRDIVDNALQIARDPEAISIGKWQLAQLPPPQSAVFYGLELRDWPADGHPPDELEYYAAGAGHFFARDSWEAGATYVYLTAGEHDEAHQQEDQGAFAVWADGRWQTCSDSPWSHGGIEQDVTAQNVVRFASAENVHNSVSALSWAKDGDRLSVQMDLSPAVGQEWRRRVEWRPGWEALRVRDWCDPAGAEFGFERPSADDTRAPYESECEAIVETLGDGFRSVIIW